MNSASGGGMMGRGSAPPTFSAPSGPLSRPASPGPLSGGVSPHLSPGQFGGAGPIQGVGGFPVIPPGVQGAKFPLSTFMRPPNTNFGPHLPPSGGFGAPPTGSGPTIL